MKQALVHFDVNTKRAFSHTSLPSFVEGTHFHSVLTALLSLGHHRLSIRTAMVVSAISAGCLLGEEKLFMKYTPAYERNKRQTASELSMSRF
jgi:hypothetical protein